MAETRTSRFLEFALIFAVSYLVVQGISTYFFPKQQAQTGVVVRMQDATIRRGHAPALTIRNGTQQELALPDDCPMPPLVVTYRGPDGNAEPEAVTTDETALPCPPPVTVAPGASATLDLLPWKYSLFDRAGTYDLTLRVDAAALSGSGHTLGTSFRLSEPNAIVRLFRGLVSKPMLFALISIASVLPDHSLGWSIILLTLLVKLLLFLPTQHALEGQKKMQALQSRMDALRAQYKDDPKKIQEETMRVWKEEGVNPFQSCLPMLLQFPVLIGLFFVIRDGSVLETSREYLYPIHQNLSWAFGHDFFGLNLTEKHGWLFAPLLIVMQFIQMKLTFAVNKRKASASGKTAAPTSAAETQQKVMLYALPLMIGFFALRFPSAVSLYWGVSTLFAIGQQLYVNREHVVIKKGHAILEKP